MGLSVMGILFLLDAISEAAVIASFGASSFIVFTVPHKDGSRPRYIIGGNAFGVLAALFLHIFSLTTGLNGSKHKIIYGAVAVGLAMFLMVITDTEHPPEAGLALGLTLDGFDIRTAFITLLALILLSVIKRLLNSLSIDLL